MTVELTDLEFDIEKVWAATDPRPRAELLKDIERLKAENEQLRADLGMAHANLYGTQDGALLRDYKVALERAEAENERLRQEVDHWKVYSSGQGKLIQSGVFVPNDEYTQLASKAHRANAAEAKLAEAMEALNIESIVSAASIVWCSEKDRETFMDDIRYFESNWRALPGLAMFVLREFLSRAHKIIGRDPR